MTFTTPNPTLIPGPTMNQWSFGRPAAIVLFRGAGGLLGSSGSGNSGMDTLAARLNNRFSDYYLMSQVFESFAGNVFNFTEIGSAQGTQFLDRVLDHVDDTPALGIVGYSAGGLSAIRLAKSQAPRPVDLLVQLDSFEPLSGTSPEDEVLPDNVLKGLNYYQTANRFNFLQPGFDPTDLQGARNVRGSQNINAEALVSDRSITHRTIEDNTRLQTEILNDIEEFVLSDLAFDGAGQLEFSGGAQPINNLVSLLPGRDQTIGQVVLNDPVAINPEFSFRTRFQFRLSSESASVLPGFSFWVQPEPPIAGEATDTALAIAVNPVAATPSLIPENAVAVLTPHVGPSPLSQAIAPLDLDSGEPLTAWVDYDGSTDQLSVLLSDSLTRPSTPLLTTAVDLWAIAGPQARFGFQATVGGEPRQADLLTWHLHTNANDVGWPTTVPETYLNLGLTQRAASAFWGIDLPFTPLEVGGVEFSTLFDEAYYLRLNPDVLTAVVTGGFATGYEHFTQHGWLEGRAPSSLYDEAFYLATNSDVAQAMMTGGLASGLAHFVQAGHLEGRDPSAQFDQAAYLLANPDVAAAIAQGHQLSAFEHYVEAGAAEGRDPQRLLFQEQYYLAQNPDVAAAVAAGNLIDGFEHYLSYGCREGRSPTALFNEAQYLDLNADVAAAVEAGSLPCGWAHYLLAGRFEGRSL
jgi:hypothetical protein